MASVARVAAVRIALLAPLVTAAMSGPAAEPPADAASELTRAELLRKWDLNSDGKVDEGEAEIVRARNRRKRIEILSNPEVDPLTGRLKDAESADEAAPRQPEIDAEPAAPRAKRNRDVLPGTQAPLPRTGGDPAGTPDTAAGREPDRRNDPNVPADGEPTAAPRRAAPRTRPSWSRGAPLLGGARAGAPAVRGYGSGVPPLDLNAGRLYGGLPGARSRPPANSGGLLPTPRPPASPAVPKPPRSTVEDFDPY